MQHLMTNRSKKKILMVGPALDMQGGVASVVNGYLDSGLGDCCDLAYVSTATEGSRIHKALHFYKSYQHIKRLINDVDIVHIHAAMRNSFERKYRIAKLAKGAGKKLIIHEHDGEMPRLMESSGEDYRNRVREFFAWADVVIVLSEEWRRYFAENICDAGKLVVMHNAVAVPEEIQDVCARQDILFLGRLGACKSPDVLLHAAKTLRARFPEVKYRFGGDGDIAKYQELANNLGIADQCEFCGWVTGEEKLALIRQTGIYCLPSRNEAMPMSMLEMMAYGIPCVMTPVGGIPQVITDGHNGCLVPVGDSDSLANRLSNLMESAENRSALGEMARKTIVEDFAIERNIRRLSEIYDEL